MIQSLGVKPRVGDGGGNSPESPPTLVRDAAGASAPPQCLGALRAGTGQGRETISRLTTRLHLQSELAAGKAKHLLSYHCP